MYGRVGAAFGRSFSFVSGGSRDCRRPELNLFESVLIHFMFFQADLTYGLIALYPFNGNANDESGHSLNGVVHGATLVADRLGRANSAYSFDGISNYIFIGDPVPIALQIQQALSFSLWVLLPAKLATYACVLGCQHDSTIAGTALFFLPSSSALLWNMPDGSNWVNTQSTTEVPLNQWTHIVVTRQANGAGKVYFNGTLQASADQYSWSGTISYSSAAFTIGNQLDVGRFFSGIVDDVRIYNRLLAPDEVAALYVEGGSSFLLQCIFYFDKTIRLR